MAVTMMMKIITRIMVMTMMKITLPAMFFVTIVKKRGDTQNLCKKRGQ